MYRNNNNVLKNVLKNYDDKEIPPAEAAQK